jgi:hypothetical protein
VVIFDMMMQKYAREYADENVVIRIKLVFCRAGKVISGWDT